MRYLLDTHIYLWYLNNSNQLSKNAYKLINEADEVYVSSASIWEIAIKLKLGKIDVDLQDLVNAIVPSGFMELAITAQHARSVLELPDIHRDPFDRILIAQAICEPLYLLTADNLLRKYSTLVEII